MLLFVRQILHVLAASLARAGPILAAALAAGFRESGVQSLKNLEHVDALPMVAVRSAGLGFCTVIGYVLEEDGEGDEDEDGVGDESAGDESTGDGREMVRSLVSSDALRLLLGVANERFEANTERVRRFRECLFKGMGEVREDDAARAKRKRKEGLQEREMKAAADHAGVEDGDALDDVLDGGLDMLGS